MNKLDNFTHCVKCGTCRTVCPVFKTSNKESHVARGKIALLEFLYENDQKFSEDTLKILESCVVCGSCQHVCPRDVEFIDIIEMAREKVVRDNQMPILKKAFLKSLKNEKMLKTTSKFSQIIPKKSGLYFKLPLINKYFPKPQKQLSKKIRKENKAEGKELFKVLFFPGCSMNYVFSETGFKLVKVLNKIGITVIYDDSLKCCGFPHLTAGEKNMFEELRNDNKEIFEKYNGKVKYIVSGCATCGSALKNNYNLSIDFKDINEIIKENIEDKVLKKIDLTTYFHHPCHLMKHQSVKEQPEDLLKTTTDFQKLEGADLCCGFGGSFSIFQSKLSKKIGNSKSEMIKNSIEKSESKNKALVTSCPGCIIQLTDSVKRNNVNIPVMHIIDILYKVLED